MEITQFSIKISEMENLSQIVRGNNGSTESLKKKHFTNIFGRCGWSSSSFCLVSGLGSAFLQLSLLRNSASS